MNRYQLLFLSFFVSAGLVAETNSAKGTFSVDGHTVQMHNAYLHTEKNPFEASQTGYVLTLSDVEIAPELLTKQAQLAFKDDLHYVQVYFDSDQSIYSVVMHHPKIWDGGHMSGGGTPYKLELDKFTGDVAEGRVYLKEKSCFRRDDNLCKYDVSFKATLLAEKQVTGEPLGEGGGEPGRAYMAFLKAIADGDVKAYRKYLSEEGSASFTDEEFIAGLPMIQSLTATNVKILGGVIDGDTAILNVTGKEDGQEKLGTVTMKKVGENWIHVIAEWEPTIIS